MTTFFPGLFRRWLRTAVLLALLALPSTIVAQPAESDPPNDDEAETSDALVSFGGWTQLQVSGVLGDNVGVAGGPELNIGDHAIGLSLFLAGGTHLRTGAELRYRWQIIDRLAWWFAPGIAFDVLFVDEYTVWSRLTMFSTGVDIALSDLFYVGVDFTISPRVAPLSVTFVDDGEVRRQVEHGSNEFPYDLAYGFLRPGVSFGIRL